MSDKILKYTFTTNKVRVVNGELEVEEEETTAYFTMLISGLDMFQEEYGKPLINIMTDLLSKLDKNTINALKENKTVDKLSNEEIQNISQTASAILNPTFIKALASASYTIIVDGEPVNNEYTLNTFKESDMYKQCISDSEFVNELLGMAMACISDTKNKKKKQTSGKGKN